MREAPDVILIGEILDATTMEAAIAFAETGHLCLATLHSNNADQTLERILNFFPETRAQERADEPGAEPARRWSRSAWWWAWTAAACPRPKC